MDLKGNPLQRPCVPNRGIWRQRKTMKTGGAQEDTRVKHCRAVPFAMLEGKIIRARNETWPQWCTHSPFVFQFHCLANCPQKPTWEAKRMFTSESVLPKSSYKKSLCSLQRQLLPKSCFLNCTHSSSDIYWEMPLADMRLPTCAAQCQRLGAWRPCLNQYPRSVASDTSLGSCML